MYTTLDTALQERAEAALSRGLERLERDAPAVRRNLEARRLQGAVVVTRPEDGAILALVGGRDYADTQFNRALHARRQPGSCFKPFVYLAGFERAGGPHGLTPATELQDRPLELVSGGRTGRPSNRDGTFRGSVTAREALQDSINVATVRAATRVGLDAVIETAAACGIETPLRALPSLALGAQEVTPVELAAAYGTLASGGVRADLWIIAEIRDRDGGRLDRPERSIRRVIDEAPVFLVNDVLRGVLETGTARRARTLGYGGPAAGKTGTSDDARDAWFVGYTPELLALVWVGYDDNARIGVGGSSAALPIWVDLMAGSEAFGSGRGFRRPPGVVRRRVDPETGYLAVPGCPRSVSDWYPIEAAPDTRCPTHRRRGFRNWFRRLIGRDEEV